jgi:hypothetical protein
MSNIQSGESWIEGGLEEAAIAIVQARQVKEQQAELLDQAARRLAHASAAFFRELTGRNLSKDLKQ